MLSRDHYLHNIAIFASIMGKNQSKEQEIIIAQNGANSANARQTAIEDKVNHIYAILMCISAGVVILYLYILYQHYKKHTQKLFKKQIDVSALALGQAVNANQRQYNMQQV